MESAFDIIVEPNRRAILSLLASSELSVGEIERQLGMTQPTVSKHLRVLREAGLVEAEVDAQRRLYRLNPEPLKEVDMWLEPFRRFWSKHVDALERHLDRLANASSMNRMAGRPATASSGNRVADRIAKAASVDRTAKASTDRIATAPSANQTAKPAKASSSAKGKKR